MVGDVGISERYTGTSAPVSGELHYISPNNFSGVE